MTAKESLEEEGFQIVSSYLSAKVEQGVATFAP
jgi:hypothetical protein